MNAAPPVPAPKQIEDPSLPHQYRIVVDRELDLLSASCNCMRDDDGRFEPLVEPAHTIDPKAALEAYKAHIEAVSGP